MAIRVIHPSSACFESAVQSFSPSLLHISDHFHLGFKRITAVFLSIRVAFHQFVPLHFLLLPFLQSEFRSSRRCCLESPLTIMSSVHETSPTLSDIPRYEIFREKVLEFVHQTSPASWQEFIGLVDELIVCHNQSSSLVLTSSNYSSVCCPSRIPPQRTIIRILCFDSCTRRYL